MEAGEGQNATRAPCWVAPGRHWAGLPAHPLQAPPLALASAVLCRLLLLFGLLLHDHHLLLLLCLLLLLPPAPALAP